MTIEEIYELFRQHPHITTDTRNCPEGSIFIALKGEHFNGNDFVEQALQSGCAYALTDDPVCATSERAILVDNCLHTLQNLAKHHRIQLGIPVIGITGTNGKTTTKELLAATLSSQYNVLYTQGNLNNHIGVPLTLLQMNATHELAIIEMGANHSGEIKTLSEIALPDYGLITNVGKAHLEGFGSFENVVRTKGELYDYLRQSEGKVFIDYDNTCLRQIATGIDKVSYGQTPDLFVWGELAGLSPYVSIDWHCKEGSFRIDSQLIGAYNLSNILAAITIGKFLGITPDNINRSIAAYTPHNNRSQLMRTANNYLFIDAYNANPTSMMAALENFNLLEAPNKALILGDMKELGENSREEHRKIADFIDGMQVDMVFLCGPCFGEIVNDDLYHYNNIESLSADLEKMRLSGYYILIKGSRSMKLEKIVEVL